MQLCNISSPITLIQIVHAATEANMSKSPKPQRSEWLSLSACFCCACVSSVWAGCPYFTGLMVKQLMAPRKWSFKSQLRVPRENSGRWRWSPCQADQFGVPNSISIWEDVGHLLGTFCLPYGRCCMCVLSQAGEDWSAMMYVLPSTRILQRLRLTLAKPVVIKSAKGRLHRTWQ